MQLQILVAALVAAAPEVYVAVLSDRSMFAGMVSATASMIESSSAASRLRILVIVPRRQEPPVERALGCVLAPVAVRRNESGNASKGFQGSGIWYETLRSGAQFAVVGFAVTKHRHEEVRSVQNQRLTSPFNYARLYLHKLPERWLPARADRLVYLDADVTVRGDVVALSDYALKDHLIAAVPRPERKICGQLIDCRPDVLRALRAKGITKEDLLDFNAGVMVYNLAAWRTSRVLKDIEAWIRLNRSLRLFKLGTNPPMVLAVRRAGIAPLDRSWNCQKDCEATANVVHYSGAIKPWHLKKNESTALGWHLPALSRACAADLNALGIRARRLKRPPTDFIGVGMPYKLVMASIRKGDIPSLRIKHQEWLNVTQSRGGDDEGRNSSHARRAKRKRRRPPRASQDEVQDATSSLSPSEREDRLAELAFTVE